MHSHPSAGEVLATRPPQGGSAHFVQGIFILFLSILWSLIGCSQTHSQEVPGADAVAAERERCWEILRASKDADTILRAALSLCKTPDVATLDRLLASLRSSGFRHRLDPELISARYVAFRRMRLSRILCAIASLPGAQARAAFASLLKDKAFIKPCRRKETGEEALNRLAFIFASGYLRDPPEVLLTFLDSQGTPENGVGLVVRALARMRTPASCALIEKRILSPKYRPHLKEGWLYCSLCAVRNDRAVIGLYRKLLRSRIDNTDVLTAVVESFFDYKPDEWFGSSPSREYRPPKWKEYTTEALQSALEIADEAQRLGLSAETRVSVHRARKLIADLLRRRKLVPPERMRQLLAELDNPSFKRRQAATTQLEKLGDAAELDLRRFLTENPSLEARKRAERLLRKVSGPPQRKNQ